MDGIINVLKPPGMTSHDVVGYLRRLLGQKSVGHTGTLDPGVAGVLPICVGNATRVAEFVTDGGKVYRAEITFGVRTDTQDSFGNVLAKNHVSVSYEQALTAVPGLTGEIRQIPPMVSAIKVGGRRLYDIARQGQEVPREPRKIFVNRIVPLQHQWYQEFPTILFEIECSKGTYVRTICADWGEALGCGAHMSYLLRTRSGSFELANAWTLAEISQCIQAGEETFLLPLDSGVAHLPALEVKMHRIKPLLNGLSLSSLDYTPAPIIQAESTKENWVRLYSQKGQFLALGLCDNYGRIRPKKVFALISDC